MFEPHFIEPGTVLRDSWGKNGGLVVGRPVVQGLTMQADFQKVSGGKGAGYWTVQFGVNPPPGGIYSAEATITWSTSGNSTKRRISVVNGATISGTSEMVNVSVLDVTNATAFAAVVGQNYNVDMLVTPGCRPSQQQPPRLYGGSFTVNGVATSGAIPVPQDAGAISVYLIGSKPAGTTIARGDVIVALANSIGGLSTYDWLDAQQWTALPPGTTFIDVQSATAGVLSFSVQWGIEG